MSDRILYESEMYETINEATPNAPETIQPGTGQSDIAQQTPKTRLARNVISQSLPFMLSFVQPLNTPTGFTFGFKERQDTSITHPDYPESRMQPPSDQPGQGNDYQFSPRIPDDPMNSPAEPVRDYDPIIVRRMIKTDVREIIFDMTNEIITDVSRLFRDDFPALMRKFIENGGEVYGIDVSDIDNALQRFFLPQMISAVIRKTNKDFTTWVDSVATVKGTVDIPTLSAMPNLFTAIGELRESLYKSTHKSGSVFILCTPRIANYISGSLGMTSSNGSDVLEQGKPRQTTKMNGFVGQYGDIYVYQYDYKGDVTGGDGASTEADGSIIMGFDGENGPNTASVYYSPYKEYLVQGGDDYETGHSNIFFRVRDAWDVNPLDTFDKSISDSEYDQNDPSLANKSQYLVKVNVTFGETAIA